MLISTLSIAGLPRSVRFRRWSYPLRSSAEKCSCDECSIVECGLVLLSVVHKSTVIFRPMVNSGSIPEGEQISSLE